MNARWAWLLPSLIVSVVTTLAACATDDAAAPMTRHQVCERLAASTCERMAACEPTVAPAGCRAREMAACCPDGVCAEAVVADAERLAACEAAVTTLSCSDLTSGNLPDSCRHLTNLLPVAPDAGTPDGPPSTGPDGVLEVNWAILAGGTSLSCADFLGTQTVRIVATSPTGTTVTRDFSCAQFSALTTLPVGPYSIVAQARSAAGQVVQQSLASTVVVAAAGSSSSFTFQVTTTLGSYCTSLTNTVCDTCAPTETSCKTEVYGDCCAGAGSCGRPALADPQTFAACLSAYGSGSYCTGTSPPVCQGAIDIW